MDFKEINKLQGDVDMKKEVKENYQENLEDNMSNVSNVYNLFKYYRAMAELENASESKKKEVKDQFDFAQNNGFVIDCDDVIEEFLNSETKRKEENIDALKESIIHDLSALQAQIEDIKEKYKY